MTLILGALALAAMSGVPKPPFATLPDGTLVGLISADDYPPESIRNNEQGTVTVRFRVDATGLVSRCEIEKSSGYEALDKRTCEIVQQRAKFSPARDKRGKGVPITISQAVTWRLENPPPRKAENFLLRGTFSRSFGQPVTCRFERVLTVEGQVRKTSGECPKTQGMPPLPEVANATPQFINHKEFRVGDEPPSDLKPGDQVQFKQVAKIEVDAMGEPVCKIVETAGELGDVPGACTNMPRKFVPMTDSSGKAIPFVAYYIIEGLARLQKTQ